MLRILKSLPLACLGLVFGALWAHASGDKLKFVDPNPQALQVPQYTYVTNQVIIKFKAGEIRKVISKDDKNPLKTLAGLIKLPEGASLDESMFGKWVRNDHKKKKRADPGIEWSRYMLLNLPAGLTPEQCVELLKNNPLVEYVERQSIGTGGATYPNDDQANLQWYIAGPAGNTGRIHIAEAWDITTGSSNVIVAVLDTGCNTNHSEFQGRLVPGWDFYNGDSDPTDDHGHGTMVASIICATGSNFAYGAGIDWNCRLMPVKILNSSNGGGTDDGLASGIDFAVSNEAKIINLSAGGWTAGTTTADSISNALARGCVFVTITHNYPRIAITYPGTLPEVITVGASDSSGSWCSFSLTGSSLDLVAPGTNMYAITYNGTESGPTNWGTSFAAPQVAGVAALICSLRPELNNQQVSDLLCAGAWNRNSPTNGWDDHYGWGVLDAYNSLLLAKARFCDFSVTNGANMSLAWNSPPNGSNRQPFKVEYVAAVTGLWTSVSNISYGATNAVWTDTDCVGTTTKFYRIKVRRF